jgi:hypothetical protein
MRSNRRSTSVAVLFWLAACAPALNWRELRPAGSSTIVMFPCKPTGHARDVALAGTMVSMSMFACSAGDATYALAFADLKDPSLVGRALDELGQAARSHLQAAPNATSQVLSVPGMTPNAHAVQWRIRGRLPDGRPVQERAALFAHGTQVYQATMLGERLDAEAQETFFGALRVKP